MTATKLECHADRRRSGSSLFRGCRDLFLLLVFTGLTLPLAASAAPPANDNFTNRISRAGTVVVTASNVGATLEANEPMHAGDPGGRSLWWSWTAAHTGRVTMGTSGSEVDTLLAVYTGTTLATLVEVASNDDASFGVTTSRVTFNTLAGTTYQIAVDAYEAEEGEVRLTILENDAFADRLTLAGTNLSVSGHNFDATAEPKEPAHAGRPATRSVWWTWTAPTNGLAGLVLSGDNTNVTGGNFYKTLAVYTGGVVSNLTARATNGSVLSLTNRLTFDATANTIYQVAADGVSGSSGRLQLALAFTAASQPAPPRLEMPGFAGDGAFQFSLVGQTGASYVIEASTNLIQWDELGTLTNNMGSVIFRDGAATNFPRRFYRARLP